ncbi:MAG: 4-phosphoerythronate dehydrogenase [Candidatus Brocadiia bacterium]
MRILADENIPFAREAFATLGDVELVRGRELGAEALRDCDLLVVRSVTRVDEGLLGGSRVRFVGTATIGTDHVDLDFLRRQGIAFASAPGSNANSVAEYVVAALLVLARRGGTALEGKSIGVVGVGNVGSRVVAKCQALGMKVLENDPPLARQSGDPRFLPLDALLEADFLTLHVPLTREGEDATYHLADERLLARMRPDARLLNTSRGAVADGSALARAIDAGAVGGAVLDVWEGEPAIDVGLLGRVALGTPHIAGYSFDGKVAATEMVYRAACEALGAEATWSAGPAMPPPEHPRIELACRGRSEEDVAREAVLTVYDIEADDRALRGVAGADDVAGCFDRLRKTYRQRREFHNTSLLLRGASEGLAAKLAGIGFRISR